MSRRLQYSFLTFNFRGVVREFIRQFNVWTGVTPPFYGRLPRPEKAILIEKYFIRIREINTQKKYYPLYANLFLLFWLCIILYEFCVFLALISSFIPLSLLFFCVVVMTFVFIYLVSPFLPVSEKQIDAWLEEDFDQLKEYVEEQSNVNRLMKIESAQIPIDAGSVKDVDNITDEEWETQFGVAKGEHFAEIGLDR